MFEQRLRDLYAEIELLNYQVQNGCIDRIVFSGMNNEETMDYNETMAKFDKKLGDAMAAFDDLLTELYEEQQQ